VAGGSVKPGPGLKAYLDASRTQDQLYADIQKHVLVKAGHSDRRTDVLHPSEMIKTDWCHRAAAYTLTRGPLGTGSTTFTRENIFREGHNTHAKWQRWLQEMGRLAGDWHCLSCNTTFWCDQVPTKCIGCMADAGRCIEYAEVPLNAPRLSIGGKSDGYCPDDGCLIEIKTLGLGSLRFETPGYIEKFEVHAEGRSGYDLARMWKGVVRPLPAAWRQGQLYMYLANHFEDLSVDHMLYIYDFKPTQESKSFIVAYDEAASEPLIEAAQVITDCVEAGSLPPCNINYSRGCKRCRAYEEKS
jgi:hypothetical protein